MPRARNTILVTLLFAALTVVMTWPQVLVLRTKVPAHFDSYFSMWRLAWIAHQITTAPLALFDANIFYPQRFTLALSDPIVLPGLVAAPWLILGASPVTVYNVMVLGTFVLCGVAAWLLAARLTGSAAAGVVAGIIFAFAPYRFEHYFHLEILMAFWIPLALIALHAACERGRVDAGFLTGILVIAQGLSCLYYAVYLGIALAIAGLLLIRWRDPDRGQVLAGLFAGAVIASAATLIYISPLLAIKGDVVPRGASEAAGYSATLSSYLSTPYGNRLYGRFMEPLGGGELRLFPGILALSLAVGAVRRPRRVVFVYVALLVVAAVFSFGMNAPVFRWLRGAASVVSMLRVPARFGAIVLCALSVLAAFGTAALLNSMRSTRARRLTIVALCAAMLVEYSTALTLQSVRPTPTGTHRWLARQPRGPVAELPMPRLDALPGRDAERQYASHWHWQPLVNGYSGYYPRSYVVLLYLLSVFPRGGWIDHLLNRGARVVVLHEREMNPATLAEALRRLELDPRMRRVARFPDLEDPTWVYERK
jgi:hypothetical protein